MKILVTGGAGFIGANLCERLLSDGHTVFCMDNFFSSKRKNISEFETNENFILIEHDIIGKLPQALREDQFDQIYHLACPASPSRYQSDHIFTLRTSFEGTLNVLNFAKSCKNIPKVLFSSTSEVYGDPLKSPQSEEYRGNVNPHGIRSCYDEGKRVAESLCMNFWRDCALNVKIIRIFNTYGPRMDKDDGRAVSNLVNQALEGKSLSVFGDGMQTRSFQYIDDLIEGMLAFMALDENFPGPINLGNPNEISILKLAYKLKELINQNLEIVFEELPLDDPLQRCPDISLAKSKLGWAPKVDLDTGLSKTIEYFKLHT